jgi:hypothetical protein
MRASQTGSGEKHIGIYFYKGSTMPERQRELKGDLYGSEKNNSLSIFVILRCSE